MTTACLITYLNAGIRREVRPVLPIAKNIKKLN